MQEEYIERYCPSKTPMWEHDKECYYHGHLQVCPHCGTVTRPCIDAEYKPIVVEGLGDVEGAGVYLGPRDPSEMPDAYSKRMPGDPVYND